MEKRIAMKMLAESVLMILSLAAGSTTVAAHEHCEEVDGITSICGLHSPEDLTVTADGNVLFTQMAAGAGVSLLNVESLQVSHLYRADESQPQPGWGDPGCVASPGEDILVHGLDLSKRTDDRWQLLTTNHGGRESVEAFEFFPGESPALVWRGCIELPEELTFNDVASLPGGGFLATHQYTRGQGLWGLIKAMLGMDTGAVYRWSPGAGFQELPETAAPFPNGIVAAPDGKHFFVNSWAGGEVRKYSLEPVVLQGVAQIQGPDNASWGPDGQLLVASHRYSLTSLADGFPQEDGGPAPLRFAIVSLDPQTMEHRDILLREGAPMGAGTTAVMLGEYLYIGSYLGDRMIRVPVELLN